MNDLVFLATSQGLVIVDQDAGGWRVSGRRLTDRQLTGELAREGVLLVGSRSGVFRSDDLGETWRDANQGLNLPHVRWMAFHPQVSDLEFVGTEPAGIFYSQDGGEGWHTCPEVIELREAYGWWLPYSPEAGCVRGFAFHGQRAYAAVEVGGLLRSDDRGQTWRLAGGSSGTPEFGERSAGQLPADVHSVEVHPSSEDLVFAATNAGVFCSADGGAQWDRIDNYGYTRAICLILKILTTWSSVRHAVSISREPFWRRAMVEIPGSWPRPVWMHPGRAPWWSVYADRQ
jgi:hypothetical protein